MTLPAGVMLPAEIERAQIFYTLKRWSSYTAWKRISGFYQAWADIIEKSLRDGNIPEEESSYVFLCPKVSDAAPMAAYDTASVTILASGQRTPVSGRWVLQDSLSNSVTLAAGEVLPQHQGTTAQWVLAHR